MCFLKMGTNYFRKSTNALYHVEYNVQKTYKLSVFLPNDFQLSVTLYLNKNYTLKLEILVN